MHAWRWRSAPRFWRAQIAGDAANLPQPAKKDTPKAIKPKNCGSHGLGRAGGGRPGDRVTFKVTAKLDPGYHIYKYSKTPAAGGPINTSFDFFDPAGLKVEGDWTPSNEPEKHKDPNFAEMDFVEYHEDEVTWSIKLKIPDGIEPGKKDLRCQAGYRSATPRIAVSPANGPCPTPI